MDLLPTSKRGLRKFISDIRMCTSHEAEISRVRKELAKIRAKFASSKQLKSYDRKKYIWKLVYIRMLGYEVEFGHIEAVNLASSPVPAEKQVGYLALGVLIGNDKDLVRLAINSLRNDLQSDKPFAQALALNFCGNIGGREIASVLGPDIMRFLVSDETPLAIRKKAAICAACLAEFNDSLLDAEMVVKLAKPGLSHTHELTLAMIELLSATPDQENLLLASVPLAIQLLETIVLSKSVPEDYMYHDIPCPILQIRTLQYLQRFPPPSDPASGANLIEIMQKLLAFGTEATTITKATVMHAVRMETVNLVLHYGARAPPELLHSTVRLLAHLIVLNEANVRYLGLSGMTRLAQLANREGMARVLLQLREHEEVILASLDEKDDSIRKRSLDLVFAMCNVANAREVVQRLLKYLATANYAMKPEVVLKIAILTERFAVDRQWYLDTIFHLVESAGEFVSEDIWYRTVKIVINTPEVQEYAAKAALGMLQSPHVHEIGLVLSAYLLGEFGNILVEQGYADPVGLFETINQHFSTASSQSRRMFFHAYAKLSVLYTQDLNEEISLLFDAYRDSSDLELQQRACEYFMLASLDSTSRSKVLEPMPEFSTKHIAAGERDIFQGHENKSDTSKITDTGSNHHTVHSEKKELQHQNQTEVEEGENETCDSSTGDLLDLGTGDYSVSAPTIRLAKDISLDLYRKSLMNTKGLLHEDTIIQVGIQHQYQHASGKVVLFIGNKTNLPCQEVICTVPGDQNLSVQASFIEPFIGPRSQVRQQLLLTCMVPFEKPHDIKLSYSCNGLLYFVDLRLPTAVTSFLKPVKFTNADFTSRWDSMGEGSQHTFAISTIGIEQIDEVLNILEALHFGAWKGADAISVFAAGTLETATVNARTQKPTIVGCLVQIALVQGSANVSIRSANRAARLGIAHVLNTTLVKHEM